MLLYRMQTVTKRSTVFETKQLEKEDAERNCWETHTNIEHGLCRADELTTFHSRERYICRDTKESLGGKIRTAK